MLSFLTIFLLGFLLGRVSRPSKEDDSKIGIHFSDRALRNLRK